MSITFEFRSDDRSIQQALLLMQQRMEKLVEKQRKLSAESQQGGRAGVKAAEANEKAIYSLQLAMLKLQSAEERRAAAGKRHDEDANRRIDEQARKLQERSNKERRAASQARGFLADQIGDIKSMVLQWGSVTAAIGFATQALSEHRAEMLRLGEASEERNKRVIQDLALAGDLPNAPALIERQETHPTATREQVAAAQRGVRGAAPNMPTARFADIADEAARTAPLFRGAPEAIQALAEAAGEIADTLPELRPADVVDLALSLQQKAGADLPKVADPSFQRATKILRETQAVDAVEAMSIGVEALDANLEPRSLEKLAAKLTERVKLPPPPANRALTQSEKNYRAFAREDDASRRLEMLRGDEWLQEQVLGDQLAHKFREINFDKAFSRAQTLREDMGRDYVGQQVEMLPKTPEGLEATQGQRMAKGADVAKVDEENYGRALKRAQDKLDELHNADNAGAFRRWLNGWDFYLREFTASSPAEALRGTMANDARAIEFGEQENAIARGQAERRGEFHSEPAPRWLQRLDEFIPGVSDFYRRERDFVPRIVHGLFGRPAVTPPLVDREPPAVVPPRPAIEPPAEEPPRINRQPAPLGPTMDQRRRAAAAARAEPGEPPPPPVKDQRKDQAGQRFVAPPLLGIAAVGMLGAVEPTEGREAARNAGEPASIETPREIRLPTPAVFVEPLEPIHLASPAVSIETPEINLSAPRVKTPRPPAAEIEVPPRLRPPAIEFGAPAESIAESSESRTSEAWRLPRASREDEPVNPARVMRPDFAHFRPPAIETKFTAPPAAPAAAAPSLAEQLSGVAEALAAGSASSIGTAALPLVRQMLDALMDLADIGRQTRDNTAGLNERRLSPGVVPLAAVRRDRQRHGE